MNQVFLKGSLGKDPELKYTATGMAVANFSMATSSFAKGKDGQFEKRTEWHNITAWGKTAETCGKYLKKGSPALIQGRLETRSWDDKDGKKQYKTSIVVESLELLGSKADGQQSSESNSSEPMSGSTADDLDNIPF